MPETAQLDAVFRRAARSQVLSTLLVGLVAMAWVGLPGLVSALIGGGAVLAGSFIAVRIARRSQNSEQANAILINMLVAEASKILVIVLLLWLGFKLYRDHVVVMALFAALAAAALLSGTAVYALGGERKQK